MSVFPLVLAGLFGAVFALAYARYEKQVRARTGSLWLTVFFASCILFAGVAGLVWLFDAF